MPIPGNLLTTAMAVMPHKDVDQALALSLSLDVYTNGEIFSSYARSIRKFLDRGGVLCWGIVPTNFEPFEKEDLDSLAGRLTGVWEILQGKGIDREFLLSRSLLSPATCCLVNPDGDKTVEKAFRTVRELSDRLREKFRLCNPLAL